MRNDIALYTDIGGELVSNFKLREFENAEGLTMVHPSVLRALELLRADLCRRFSGTVYVIVTNAVRTEADNARLGRQLGWTDEGGLVARESKHLSKYGGIAMDLKAKVAASGAMVRQSILGATCRKYFDYVKDDYRDGHVHADNRVKGAL
jgi:hypothetical protein